MNTWRSEIELEQACALIAGTQALTGRATLPLRETGGLLLAEDIYAPIDQPPFDRSPLDGYALRAEDTTGAGQDTPVFLRVVDKLYAGDVPGRAVESGQAVRIMTGAMLPPRADCVIRQEDTDLGEQTVAIYRQLKHHQNFCFRGEDFRAGSLLLPTGTKLTAATLGVLASAGVTHITARPKAKVALLTTGDELFDAQPGVSLPPGKIYSSNLDMLYARLTELGYRPVYTAQTGDDPNAAADAIRAGLESADLMITTGGVSVGEKDIFHEVMPLLGAERIFHRVKIKPGTPAMFSRVGGKPVLSLSGNPFAAAATFELLARPLLAAISGDHSLLPLKAQAVMAMPYNKETPTRRFVRGRLENGGVTLQGGHSSGQLRSLVGCNCLVEILPGTSALKGDCVAVYII
ncbi:MAG: molybdopterin molybdotransferase MoeA [Oscillospiraceae bacterium]|nr:molybdopterin molybdotransferase MoeA [Oscillospiraceae bacterium]